MGHRTERFPFEKGLVTENTVPCNEHSKCHKEAWGQRAAPGHCEPGSGAKGSELKCLLAKMGRIHSKTVLSYLFVPFHFSLVKGKTSLTLRKQRQQTADSVDASRDGHLK